MIDCQVLSKIKVREHLVYFIPDIAPKLAAMESYIDQKYS
jgi:hypothetical protein